MVMNQNWFPSGPQYGAPQQQGSWGPQQNQGRVQGGVAQWAGQPRPQQQTGFHGNQQQFAQYQQFGQQSSPALGGGGGVGGQFGGQQQLQGPPPPVQTQFLTQQAYAQEHERRVREERRKKELEEQKRKLQSLSVAKPTPGKQNINLDNLFEAQLPDVSRQTRAPPPPSNPTPHPVVSTPLSGQNEGTQTKQSSKARSWASEDFSGLFAQHTTEASTTATQDEGDNFGDFQSSGQLSEGFPAFPATSRQQATNHIQPGGHMMQPGNHMMQPGNHMMQPGNQPGGHMMQPGNQPGGHMMQPGGHMMQPGGHVIPGGSHMISTSAYQEPLSSTNVQEGMQGSQPPGSPQKQHTHFSYSASYHTSGLTQSFSTHITTSTPANIAPQQPQGANIGPPHVVNPVPTAPPPGSVESAPFHPLYHKVHRLCRREGGGDEVSTELLYPVLLSSSLPRAQLRNLWARANKGKPGQLTRVELFVLLGLVGLAQAGNRDPSVDDLRKAPSIPVPTLPGLSALSPSSGTPLSPSTPSSLQPAAPPENDFMTTPPQQASPVPSQFPPLGYGAPELGPSFAPPSLPPPLTAANLSPSPSPTPTMPLSGPPPPSPHAPPANQTGAIDKQAAVKDDFGAFAQFSVPPPSLLPTSSATSLPSPSPLLPPHTLPHIPADGKSQGWADFGQFSSSPLSTPLPANTTGVQQQIQQPINEQGLPPNKESPLPQKVAAQSTKSRTFEFQSASSQAPPTIDGMERDLLSKLTPTLPRKAGAETTEDKKKDKNTDVPAKTGLPKVEKKRKEREMGGEEGWRLCLCKAAEVLATCVEVLGEVEEKELLHEISQAQEAQNRLRGLAEVYRFSKRIFATLSTKYPETACSAGEEVRKRWTDLNSLLPDNTMESVYTLTCPPPPASDPDILSDTISHCAVCLMSKSISLPSSLSLDTSPEEYGLPLLFHCGQTYHAPCANFWRHLVSEELPVFG